MRTRSCWKQWAGLLDELPRETEMSFSRLAKVGPVLGLLAVYLLFAWLRYDRFVTWDNTAIMLQQTAVIGIGAIGMTVIIISGGVDLSFGSIIAVSSVVVALLLQEGWSPWMADIER